MKAMVIENYGGPEQLKLTNVPVPEPLDHEVQIQIEYAGVNPVDWKIREGSLEKLFTCSFPAILGWDVSGTISKVGKNVKDFKVGDAVFSYCLRPEVKWGTYAEFTCVEADQVALKPKNLTFAEAAAIPVASLTAWQALNEAAQLKKDEMILVHAGAGGVGGFAIQIAKNIGAVVYTTASMNHHLYVTELGADLAIDYHEKDFVQAVKELCPSGVDVVFDTLGGNTLEESYGVLKSNGRLVSIVEQPDSLLAKKSHIQAFFVLTKPDKNNLKEIAKLFENGKMKVPHIEEFRLEDAAKAQEKIHSGHTQGKIVLKVR